MSDQHANAEVALGLLAGFMGAHGRPSQPSEARTARARSEEESHARGPSPRPTVADRRFARSVKGLVEPGVTQVDLVRGQQRMSFVQHRVDLRCGSGLRRKLPPNVHGLSIARGPVQRLAPRSKQRHRIPDPSVVRQPEHLRGQSIGTLREGLLGGQQRLMPGPSPVPRRRPVTHEPLRHGHRLTLQP